MSHQNIRPETRGSTGQDTAQRVYQGRRNPTAPVGEECTVTVDGEPLDNR
jgi:hypothetical protein